MTAIATTAVSLTKMTGWKVFPVTGKVPASRHGFRDATASEVEIVTLFSTRPDADGVAVACGLSELTVLDIDKMEGLDGRDALREAGHPWLEVETPRATTPRDGEHVFFKGTSPSRTGVLPGVDIKSVGGYVVVPPSPGRTWQAEASPWDIQPAPFRFGAL